MTSETMISDPAATAPADPSIAARNGLVINLLLVATFVVMLNETAMTVALPLLMKALNVEASAAQWLTTAFLLTMAVIIPVTGFLLQRFSTRQIFMAAISLFAVGTAIAVVSPNLPVLVFARVVQASGTAIMMPLLMTTVMTLVPPDQRGKMMGNISIVMSVAPAIGPVLAGVIFANLPWPFFFALMLVFAVGAAVLGYRRMVNVTTPREAPLDYLSVVMSAIAFGGVAYGLSAYGEPVNVRITDPAIPLIVGVIVMVLFVWRQIVLARTGRALLDLSTLKQKNFTISMAMLTILMLGMFGTFVLLPIYLSSVLHLEIWQIAFMLMPGALMMGLLGPFVGRLYDRVGPTPLIVPAMAVVTAVFWALTLVTVDTPWWAIFAGHIAMSLGFAFLFGPLFTASLSSVPPNLYSYGSALLGSIQQLAGAAGVALFVALMSSRAAVFNPENLVPLPAGALTEGIKLAFMVGASIVLVAFVISFFVRKPPAQEGGWGGH
ncbi:MAG TPA: MDR family MFS transporter [Devosia sp.]|nr:MDR family MFS transporter [Devosia sp.]